MLRVPLFKENGLSRFLEDMLKYIDTEDAQSLKNGQMNESIMLRAPNGFVYNITVDNAGAIVSTVVSQ